MKPRWTLAAVLPAWLVAAWQAAWSWPFFSDDAFVSLRYADRFLHNDGLTWTDGERVEGYSNLLWVAACSAFGALGVDLVVAARALGALCTAAALWSLARALRPHDARSALHAAVAPLLVASSGTVMAWTLGGLEGPLVLACLALGFGALVRALDDERRTERWRPRTLLACSVPFALACWTRPDSPLWVAGVAVVLGIAARGAGIRAVVSRTLLFAALPLAAFASQLLFRLAYYGEWVPNTAHVKAQFDPGSAAQGLEYVASALWSLPGLTWPALAGVVVLLLRRDSRTLALVLAVPTVAWLVYLTVIGGDHFPGRRLLHGPLAPMALLGGLTVARAALHRLGSPIAAGIALALATASVFVSRTDPKFVENKYETWEWRGKVVGEALAHAFAAERPLLAVDSAGVVPFYSRLPALDMLGLCDRTIATTPFREWLLDVKARGEMPLPPGHLRGNGAYVMDRSPDLILIGPPPGHLLPLFVSAAEFESDPRFLDRYRAVLLDLGNREILPGVVEPIVTPLWTLLHGRAGVQSTAARIEIPAWLFGSYRMPLPLRRKHLPPPPDSAEGPAIARGIAVAGEWYGARSAVAVPGTNGILELELRTARAELELQLPAGAWSIAVEPNDAGVRAFAVDAAAGTTTLRLEAARDVTLAVERPAASTAAVRVRRVVLTRER